MLRAASCIRAALVFFALLTISDYLQAQAPQVASVTPPNGVPGTRITIVGTGFGGIQESGKVQVGGYNAAIISWSDTQIVAATPGSGWVLVYQTGQSNGVYFAMTPPTITSQDPSSGGPGTQVTITGTGFGSTQGSGSIRLGSLNGTVVSWSDTQIVATAAAGVGSADTCVIQYGVVSNGLPFYVHPAQLTSISPTSGVPGTQVTITGSGFGASQGGGWARVAGATGNVVSWSDTQVVATVPAGATGGYTNIYQNGVYSNAIFFSMTPAMGNSVTPSYASLPDQVSAQRKAAATFGWEP